MPVAAIELKPSRAVNILTRGSLRICCGMRDTAQMWANSRGESAQKVT